MPAAETELSPLPRPLWKSADHRDFGGIVALNDVSIQADAGEVVGIIGPNGAGKTTLFSTSFGNPQAVRGRVVLDGIDLTGKSSSGRAAGGLTAHVPASADVLGRLTSRQRAHRARVARRGGGLVADLVSFPTRRRREQARASGSTRCSSAAG